MPLPTGCYANARRWAACKRSSGVKSVATLHLMVGLPCSGKTTLAKKLEQERSALRLTPDEWQVALFGQDAHEPEHDARHSLIEAMLWKIASRALELGTNVILDFGFWARAVFYKIKVAHLGKKILTKSSPPIA